jgi:hypothetical protein
VLLREFRSRKKRALTEEGPLVKLRRVEGGRTWGQQRRGSADTQ